MMRVVIDYYQLARAAILAAGLTVALLSLGGIHPAFAGDPIGTGPH